MESIYDTSRYILAISADDAHPTIVRTRKQFIKNSGGSNRIHLQYISNLYDEYNTLASKFGFLEKIGQPVEDILIELGHVATTVEAYRYLLRQDGISA